MGGNRKGDSIATNTQLFALMEPEELIEHEADVATAQQRGSSEVLTAVPGL